MSSLILACLIIYALIIIKITKISKKYVTYFIRSTDQQFALETRNILKNSKINITHQIKEVTNEADAKVIIELVPRYRMAKHHKKGVYYPNTTKEIWFSFTMRYDIPYIAIDGDNWKYGVSESGLNLNEYRKYVIQHEFMHALGYDHQVCNKQTAPNGVCPLLYQSTRGCPTGFKCGYDVTPYDYLNKL